ncbi:MAG: hypothetical protein OQK82_07505, partial [Candidatus Pacearchaeota archaeon]|nr:hypothetical protein [Candidatus Pacearchaeota archaeon]
MVDYKINNVYQGGINSFKPSYGDVFTGYRVAANELGMTTDPRSANQIQQLNTSLNQGAIPIEVGVLNPQTFDQMPKQHFKEMERMATLTGAKISLHAPLVEPSGMGEQGWSEDAQKLAERQLTDAVLRGAELDKNGNVPITIHSTGMPGSEYEIGDDGKKILKKMVVVDRETGKAAQMLERETLYYPHKMEEIKPEFKDLVDDLRDKLHEGQITREQFQKSVPENAFRIVPLSEGQKKTPEDRLKTINTTRWDQEVTQLIFNKERADEILQQNYPQIQDIIQKFENKELDPKGMTPIQQQVMQHYENAAVYLEDNQQHVESLFHKAWKYGSEKDREKLNELSNNFQKELAESKNSLIEQSKAVHHLLMGMKNVHPKLFQPVEEFAIDKASETFANVAANAYNKFGDKAPIISIENMMPGMAFALKKEGEKGLPGMNELIIGSKEKFVKRAVMPKNRGGLGMSEAQARKQADKMIGMTLDV